MVNESKLIYDVAHNFFNLDYVKTDDFWITRAIVLNIDGILISFYLH